MDGLPGYFAEVTFGRVARPDHRTGSPTAEFRVARRTAPVPGHEKLPRRGGTQRYLRQLGFEQFCVEEQKPIGRCVRRFVGPSI